MWEFHRLYEVLQISTQIPKTFPYSISLSSKVGYPLEYLHIKVLLSQFAEFSCSENLAFTSALYKYVTIDSLLIVIKTRDCLDINLKETHDNSSCYLRFVLKAYISINFTNIRQVRLIFLENVFTLKI